MSSPQKKTAAATEGNLSVAQYHERQQAKRDALAAKAASGTTQSEIVLEGSSVVNDVEMEDLLASAGSLSTSIVSTRMLGRDALVKETTRTLRARSIRAAARDPWMPSASEIADRVGNTVPPNEIPLYVCSGIHDDALRYFSSKKTSSRSKVPEWQALCQSWNAFVKNFNKMPAAYRERVKHARERFETFSTRGRLEQLHRSSVDAGIPCAVPEGQQCTLCLPGAARLSDRDLNGYTTIRVPASLKDLRAKFLAREERDDRGTSGAVGDHSARTTFASAVRGELRTPSPFPERPAAGRPVAPMYLGGAETLSNKYDNEPAAGSFSGYYGSQYAQQSSVLSRGRRGSEAAVERVAAVEQLQSREFAALKQEMATLRAQVAQASQTASDISVDVGGRVVRLAQRVHALEQRFAPAGASASGQPS
ncbi:hypothetical protein PHYSODRAFT_337763 [Phytophthora sojae]|uniref:Uncharacterized protein n=1 Tax=Phytophthora sojae (strain P6497) TaxID=1094619 RepID=G5A248_PHYSP|nr:hypothetical protein PHYSODRAFT_337763 [Phytophthora sojae]EGZ10996.1 hypothetical protein PHYSODRAFT_337763 [Phytophthora sojae]|eukprot:XP_009533741.1 hypothetical protein PHYSODRAFT_337763 [Phytophthora sojae]